MRTISVRGPGYSLDELTAGVLAAGVFVDELLLSEVADALEVDLSDDDLSDDDESLDDLSLDDLSPDDSPFVVLLFAPGPRLSFLLRYSFTSSMYSGGVATRDRAR